MGGGGKPATLYGRDMLADGVHRRDRRAGGEQRLVDGDLVGQSQAGSGRRQQRRAAAGDQRHHQIVGGQAAHLVQQATRCFQAGGIGDGMRRLDDLDALACGAIAVTGNDQPIDRTVPGLLERRRHLRRALAGADDDGAALRPSRQVVADRPFGVCGGDGGAEDRGEEGFGIGHFSSGGSARPRASMPR